MKQNKIDRINKINYFSWRTSESTQDPEGDENIVMVLMTSSHTHTAIVPCKKNHSFYFNSFVYLFYHFIFRLLLFSHISFCTECQIKWKLKLNHTSVELEWYRNEMNQCCTLHVVHLLKSLEMWQIRVRKKKEERPWTQFQCSWHVLMYVQMTEDWILSKQIEIKMVIF